MTRDLKTVLGVMIALLVIVSLPIQAEEMTWEETMATLKAELESEIDGVGTVQELHEWFDEQYPDLARSYYKRGVNGFRVVPIGTYRTLRTFDKDNFALWNIAAEYHMPLNTINGVFTIGSHEFGSTKLYGRLFYGVGMGNIIGLDTINVEVSNNYGVNAELVFKQNKDYTGWFNPLLGISYVWVDPETESDGQANYLYAGNRFYLSKSKKGTFFSFDVRVGTAFWKSMDTYEPPGWFLSGGFTMHRDVNITKVGKPLMAPVEVGLFGNLSLEAASTKLLFPLRLRKGVSLAPFATYGMETGSQDFSALYGVGAELRLFSDYVDPSWNPYLGIQQTWLHDFPGTGSGTSVYFGARYYLTEILAIDGNLGPIFWADDTLGSPDEDLKDWVGRIGITIAFGKNKKKMDLRAAVVTRETDWGKSRIETRNFNPLRDGDIDKYDGEIQVFALESRTDDSCECVEPQPAGDLTDLKFYNVELDFRLTTDPINPKNGLLQRAEGGDRDVFIAVLFNKKHSVTKNLCDNNTFFHFVNLDDCQYFGYRWDANHMRQPEYQNLGALTLPTDDSDDSSEQPYMGCFSEFVQKITWLGEKRDFGMVGGPIVEKEILRSLNENRVANTDAPTPWPLHEIDLDNYRIGYVSYPQETVQQLREHMDMASLGVAVMIAADQGKDGLFISSDSAKWDTSIGVPEGIAGDAIVTFDADDDFSFSNHVKMEDLFSEDVTLDGFAECSAELPSGYEEILFKDVLQRMWRQPNLTVSLYGYADATPMTEKCMETYQDGDQEQLAQDRAKSVFNHLTKMGIEENRITVKGKGVKLPQRKYEPRDRCVVVRFSY